MEVNRMKMMDCVEVIVEKKAYAQDGVHMGMQGWICMEQYRDGYWLVNFPQLGENSDIATLGIKEEDLKLISVMDAGVNEKIKAQFENFENAAKALVDKPDDLSGYLI